MGCTAQCGADRHEACAETWCDCGCHHGLIDEHHDGKHASPAPRCQECAREHPCEHEKVYSGEYFATLVPQWFWICAKCKGAGAESIPQETPPVCDMGRFLGILETVDPEGAASMRRVLERVEARRATPSGEPST